MYNQKGLWKDVDSHVKQCVKCRQQYLCPQYYAQFHTEGLSTLMLFIMMVLIGKFKLAPLVHQYALRVTDMVTNHTWWILLHTKEADVAAHAYLINVSSKFDGSHKIMSHK